MLSPLAWLLTLGGARGAGWLLGLARSPIGANLLLLAAIAGGLELLARVTGGRVAPGLQAVPGLWALALLAWWVLRQRQRLMIGRFEVPAGSTDGPALGSLLASELNQLRELFREFEDGDNALPPGAGTAAGSLFDAAIQVDTQASVLEGAVSADATVSVGPLKLPTQLLARLVNLLLQGPRLAGALQVDAGRRILTAELVVAGRQRVWRVDEPAGGDVRPLAPLAQELALRIFAEIAFETPPRWTAVAALAAGLRAYRRTLRTSNDARLNLQEAERHFHDAAGEDRRFDLPQYNLGIVYNALDRPEAARSAFKRAIELNPGRFDSHYALAQRLVAASGDGPGAALQRRLALDQCDRALDKVGGPAQRARVLHLRSQAGVELRGLDFYHAAPDCRAAVRSAWSELLRAEFVAASEPAAASARRRWARELASASLLRLSHIARQARAATRVSPNQRHRNLSGSIARVRRRAARLAAWLTPDDAEARLAVGVERMERRRTRSALTPLRLAAQLPRGRADAWCTLALAQARLFREDDFEAARQKAMDSLGRLSDGFLVDLAAACRRLAAGHRMLARRLRGLGAPDQRWAGVALRMVGLVWLLSGRRPGRVLGTMLDLPTTRDQRDALMDRLVTQARGARAEAARIRGYPQRRDAARASAVADTDERPALATALEAAQAAGWFWEAGHLAELLAKVSLARREPKVALGWYDRALALFADHHPDEIGRRGMQAARARALLQAGRRADALAAATQAVRIDPMSNYERDRLADCHFELGEWGKARQAWEAALRFAPDQPQTHHNIALCWFNEALAAVDRKARRAALEQAAAAIERAQSLRAPDDPALADARFLLAEIRGLLGQLGDALALWRTLESRDHLGIAVQLRLADLMLREVWADEAEGRFEQLVTRLNAIAADTPDRMAQPVEMPAGRTDACTHQEALVWALLGKVAAVGLRGQGLTAADGPLHAARAACGALPDNGPRRQWLATCDRIDGVLALQRGDPAAARPLLERALAVSSHAEAYRHLAECLLAGLDPALDDPAARALASRVKQLLDHSEAIDLDDQLREPLTALRSRLMRVAAARWL